MSYRHTQFGWVTVVVTGVVGILITVSMLSVGVTGGAVAACAICASVIALFGWLTVTLSDDFLEARFGIGLVKKRIDLSTVRAYRVVRNPWYWGWGIRFYGRGVLYNVSGLQAVELVLRNGKELRIGSDEPDALERALRRALGVSVPLTGEEEAVRQKRGRRWRIVTASLAIAIVAGVAALIYADTRPPKVSLDPSGFHVSSAVYGTDIPLEEIVSVSLESQLPKVLLRTNGTGFGSTLRGHFRLEGLGDGQLFLEYGSAPYLFIRTRDSFVYVSFEDPAKTRQLHAELEAALASQQAAQLAP